MSRLALCGIATSLSLVWAAPAPAAEVIPSLAGRTVITATGNSGITVFASSHIDVRPPGMKLEILAGTYAGVVSDYPCNPIPDFHEFCGNHSMFRLPDYGRGLLSFFDNFTKGANRIYVFTDGVARVTYEIPELTGEIELEATGKIDGTLKPLTRTCPVTECEHLGYGGGVGEVGRPAITAAIAFADIPFTVAPGVPVPMVGSNSVTPCVYPNYGDYEDVSPEPEDHPYGCDIVPNTDNPEGSTWEAAFVAADFVAQAAPLRQGYAHWYADVASRGRTYAGYMGEQFAPPGGGGPGPAVHQYGGWGLWLTAGIDCPSGNHFDCSA